MEQTVEEIFAEHAALSHAMQSGVKFSQELKCGQPESLKHLRVGVNVALCDHGALVSLLLKKGLITEREYAIAIRDNMKHEVEKYEKLLSEHTGKKITLG